MAKDLGGVEESKGGDDVKVCLLCHRHDKVQVQKLQQKKAIDFYASLLNIERGIASQTDRSQATTLQIEGQDLASINVKPGNNMTVHCMTTLDNISCTALTSSSYDPKSATKLMNKLIMDFDDYHTTNKTGTDYTKVHKDT